MVDRRRHCWDIRCNNWADRPAHSQTPESIFELRWAHALLEQTLASLRNGFIARGKERLFDGLASFLTADSPDTSYQSAADQLGLPLSAIKTTVHRMRRDYRTQLREEIGRYRPDIVILGFLTGDMERNVLSFRDYAKPRFVLEDGKLALRNSPVPPPLEMAAREKWRSKLRDVISMVWLRYRWRSGAISEETRELTLAILDKMKATIEAAGARPAFAYLPAYGEIDRTDPGMTGPERFFFSYCRRRGIQSMYLRPYFLRRMKEGAILKTHGHWGPVEHRIAAEGIRAYLLDKKMLSGDQAQSDLERGP